VAQVPDPWLKDDSGIGHFYGFGGLWYGWFDVITAIVFHNFDNSAKRNVYAVSSDHIQVKRPTMDTA
jgi:hypothetical protein